MKYIGINTVNTLLLTHPIISYWKIYVQKAIIIFLFLHWQQSWPEALSFPSIFPYPQTCISVHPILINAIFQELCEFQQIWTKDELIRLDFATSLPAWQVNHKHRFKDWYTAKGIIYPVVKALIIFEWTCTLGLNLVIFRLRMVTYAQR